jgi:hypothetical protein
MALTKKTYAEPAGDSLFAATGVKSIPADGYKLPAAAATVLKRGQALKQGASARELTPVTAAADQVVAILADDIDPAVSKAISVYEEGEFNRYKVIFAAETTYADFEVKARMKGIYFKDVIKVW